MKRFLSSLLIFLIILNPITSSFAAQQSNEEEITLKAEKVGQVSETRSPGVRKEKKPLPIYLQPIEFVISSIFHALFFWKSSEELEEGVVFKDK